MAVKRKQLTDKQKLFVQHYLNTLNATEAARRAGYAGDYFTLAAMGAENLKKPLIRSEIDTKLKHRIPSIDETLARVADHALGDMKDFTTKNVDGTPKLDLAKAYDNDKMRLIKKWNETTVTRYQKGGEPVVTHKVNVELYPADAALDKLMRYHSLYHDVVTVDFAGELKELLRSGAVSREEVESEVGSDLARELFESIGIMVEQ